MYGVIHTIGIPFWQPTAQSFIRHFHHLNNLIFSFGKPDWKIKIQVIWTSRINVQFICKTSYLENCRSYPYNSGTLYAIICEKNDSLQQPFFPKIITNLNPSNMYISKICTIKLQNNDFLSWKLYHGLSVQ